MEQKVEMGYREMVIEQVQCLHVEKYSLVFSAAHTAHFRQRQPFA